MSEDIPQPLPRTQIRTVSVTTVNSDGISNFKNPENVAHTTNQVEEKSIAGSVAGEEDETNVLVPGDHSLPTNNDEPHAEIELNENSIISYSSSNPNENDLDSESSKDSISNGKNHDENDEEDVVDDILKFKKASIEKRRDEIEVFSVEDSESKDRLPLANTMDTGSDVEDQDDLLSIRIHRSDCLKMDRIIRHPSVMIHIVDAEQNGNYLQKSTPNKNVTYNQEHSSFILPVMTRPFSFKENKCIIPEWEETLTFNETTSYVLKPSTIIFFEIVDFIDASHSEDEYASVGWRRIAWAFWKPFSSNIFNVEKTLRLQLYNSIAKTSNVSNVSVPSVYEWYKKKRMDPYPSTLYVTISNVSSSNVDHKPQQRSCTPFQPEVGSDASVKSLAMFSSDGDESSETKGQDTLSAIYRLGEIEWNRLPGQSCRIPNSKISTLYPDNKGCLAVKFSNSGIYLACGTSNDVFIYAIDGVIEKRLTSHQGLVYTLCWFTDDSLLLSASADCTACIWDTKSSSANPVQVLPHPSFVYCSTFLFPERIIITGSFDGMVRLWNQTHISSKFWQLHQELAGHEGFVNALCSYQNKEFFSGDNNGVIIRWAFNEYGSWSCINEIKLSEIQGICINKLVLFPGKKRLLVHTRDSLLRTMDIKTTVTIQWYQGGLNDSFQCNSVITPCGSLIFSVSEDGTVNVWESNTGKQVAFYTGNLVSGCGGTVDFHPFDHIAVFSFYSSKSSSSSVHLMKHSPNTINNTMDIALYTLNETGYYSQKQDNASYSSVNSEEIEARNYGKHKLKKSKLNFIHYF